MSEDIDDIDINKGEYANIDVNRVRSVTDNDLYSMHIQKISDEIEEYGTYIQTIWMFFEPLLIGLIGSLVDISFVNPDFLLLVVLLLLIALTLRTIGLQLAMTGTELDTNERLFVAYAWVPKATVQTALSSEIQEQAVGLGMPQKTELGLQVITICILFIIITVPVGAVLISVLGPVLLKKDLKT